MYKLKTFDNCVKERESLINLEHISYISNDSLNDDLYFIEMINGKTHTIKKEEYDKLKQFIKIDTEDTITIKEKDKMRVTDCEAWAKHKCNCKGDFCGE